MSHDKKIIGSTILTAIAASLCCITPVLVMIAGATGIASTFSWIEPFRPYLIGLTILVLGYAWVQKLTPIPIGKRKQDIDCDCEGKKPTFMNSNKFLLIITIFVGFMLAFPYYAQIFYTNTKKEVVYVEQSNVHEIYYKIEGMTCLGCEAHIENEVYQLEGIIEVKANHDKANTMIKYDKTKVTSEEIEEAILKTGYKIIK